MNTAPNAQQAKKPMAARWTYAVLILALAFVLMPYLLWNATWFGRPLTESQLEKALSDRRHPREIQHALAQIESRMEKQDPSVRRWYPAVVNLASDKFDEIRLTDAWVMGQDPNVPEFHRALLQLLSDSHPMVQRNAALSLVRFRDDSGRSQILSMLQPYTLTASATGILKTRLKPGDAINPGTLVGKIDAAGQGREVRSPVPGTLQTWVQPSGAKVADGEPILLIGPSPEMTWEALRALFLVGQSSDIPLIAPFARGLDSMPPQIQQQAALTLNAIRARSGS